jgi:hypothetical protein
VNDQDPGQVRGRRSRMWGALGEVGFVVFIYAITLLMTALAELSGYRALLSGLGPTEADYWLARFTLGDALRLPVTWIVAAVLAVAVWLEHAGPAWPASDITSSAGDEASSPSGCCHSHSELPGR